MKLKLLALCLTIGLFAFGAGASAVDKKEAVGTTNAENKENLKGLSETAICIYLKQIYGDNLPTDCKDACPGWVPNPNADMVKKCAAGVAANKDKSAKVKELYNDLRGNCASQVPPYCSDSNFGIPGSCSIDDVRKACGIICCNIDDSTVSNCMSSYKDDCKNYKYKGKLSTKKDGGW